MFTSSKTKWLASIVLAAVLLALTLLGGNWGITDVSGSVLAPDPVITSITPDQIAVDSPNTTIVIQGNYFGPSNIDSTSVRITGNGIDKTFPPDAIIYHDLNNIYVNVVSSYFLDPTTYEISVIRSDVNTIPTLPTFPGVDFESSPEPLTVYIPQFIYLPISLK